MYHQIVKTFTEYNKKYMLFIIWYIYMRCQLSYYINSLNISEEMLDAPQENCCCFHYINIIYVNV